jgi:Ca2+-transporting ATPase
MQSIVNSEELVPGDLIVLDEGDAVPADLRLIEVSQLEIVESVLTGESVAVAKSNDAIRTRTRKLPLGDCKGNAFMSTVVARGRGKGVVVRTADKTEIGKISSAISSTPDAKTPMQIRLQRLGIYLFIVSVLLCGLIILIGLLRGADAMKMVTIGVALAVSVIPEGLVAVVTVTMAIGVRRMASRQAIVRKLPSVETLGSVSVICSDKTGTLTEGKMRTVEFWGASGNYQASGGRTLVDGKFSCRQLGSLTPSAAASIEGASAPLDFRLAMACCSLCNNSNINPAADGKGLEAIGDPTEVALLAAAKKAALDRGHWESAENASRLGEFAFDSARKLMSVVYLSSGPAKQPPSSDESTTTFGGAPFILAKGAPEALLTRCTYYLPDDAKSLISDRKPLDDKALTLISAKDQRMASSGLRVLGLACRPLLDADLAKSIVQSEDAAKSESDLTFIGLIGLIDPPREGVKESVAKCKSAGIRVIMITGDHVATAVAIATDLGIIEPNNPRLNRALKGVELDLLSDDTLNSLNPFPTVFARVRLVS